MWLLPRFTSQTYPKKKKKIRSVVPSRNGLWPSWFRSSSSCLCLDGSIQLFSRIKICLGKERSKIKFYRSVGRSSHVKRKQNFVCNCKIWGPTSWRSLFRALSPLAVVSRAYRSNEIENINDLLCHKKSAFSGTLLKGLVGPPRRSVRHAGELNIKLFDWIWSIKKTEFIITTTFRELRYNYVIARRIAPKLR